MLTDDRLDGDVAGVDFARKLPYRLIRVLVRVRIHVAAAGAEQRRCHWKISTSLIVVGGECYTFFWGVCLWVFLGGVLCLRVMSCVRLLLGGGWFSCAHQGRVNIRTQFRRVGGGQKCESKGVRTQHNRKKREKMQYKLKRLQAGETGTKIYLYGFISDTGVGGVSKRGEVFNARPSTTNHKLSIQPTKPNNRVLYWLK